MADEALAPPLQPSTEFPSTHSVPQTPAFVFSVERIQNSAKLLRRALASEHVSLLYAVKACSARGVLDAVRGSVDGFAVASPAEARQTSLVAGGPGYLHLTTPGLRPEWIDQIPALTHLAFNSLSQLDRIRGSLPRSVSTALRVNPGCSAAGDERYDPGRTHSKLGVPIEQAADWLRSSGSALHGLHFHNACFRTSWTPLLQTVREVSFRLGPSVYHLDWINVGGGYLWDDSTDFTPVQEAVAALTSEYGLKVFLEPGTGLVNSAGFLVASVIDIFRRQGKSIAVLDTTVNHLPEVFEYVFEPDVLEHDDRFSNDYILVGCSCLAGDLFGEYSFAAPLEIGSRVTFANVGAYSLVKAHEFNGIELPTLYMLNDSGDLVLQEPFAYPPLIPGGGPILAPL